MLIKKEILTVPQQWFNVKQNKKSYEKIYLFVHIQELKKSGKVLMVEVFGTRGTEKRFTTDGDNFVFYDYKEEKWNTRSFYGNTQQNYYSDDFVVDEKSKKVVLDYLYPKQNHKQYQYRSVGAICNEITTNKAYERRQNAAFNKSERIRRHINMATEITQEMLQYCKDKIFSQYIFFGKLSEKNRRTGTCSNCGKSFRLPKDVKHKSHMSCPKCGCEAVLFKKQFISAAKEKTLLTVCGSADKQLVISVYEIEMRFGAGMEPIFSKDMKYIRLYLHNERKAIYSYRYKSCQYWGFDWYEERWEPSDKAAVYPKNLKEVFGSKYYGVDLQCVFESCVSEVNFIKLLDNLQNYPQAEYLVKAGLAKLASEMDGGDFGEGKTLEKVLGVRKSLVPLYIERGVTVDEHRMISVAGQITNDELLRIRELKPKDHTLSYIAEILEKVSITKFLNYIPKQKALHPDADNEQIIRWYRDFLNICDELDIQLNKSGKCPKDLKDMHDKLSAQLNEISDALEAERFEYAKQKLYNENMNFSVDGFLIVMPGCREDFTKEGQALHHCVGNSNYYNDHKSGEKMIFFIRRADSPEISLATMQVDMKRQTLIQCYGANDKPPAKEVKKFARKFISRLRKPMNTEGTDHEQKQSLQSKERCA